VGKAPDKVVRERSWSGSGRSSSVNQRTTIAILNSTTGGAKCAF